MSHSPLYNTVLFSQDIAPQTSSANVAGTTLDTQGWDGVTYEFNLGAMASGATFYAYIQSSANANMSGATNVANAALTSIANTSNSNVALLDVWRPAQRYLQSQAVPNANCTFGSVAIRYRRSGILPPTQAAVQTVTVQVN
jgi:hypothetical protein